MASENITEQATDYAEGAVNYAREQWDAILGQTEDYVRENPTRSLCYGVAAGYLLNRLPIFRIFGALLRLMLLAFKPAVLIYGATKVYQSFQQRDEP